MRADRTLPQRYRAVFCYTALLMTLVGALLALPLTMLGGGPHALKEGLAFAVPALCLLAIGFVVWRALSKPEPPALTLQEGGVVVLLVWLATPLVSAVPFMVLERLTFTQAVFEAVSGWTTTGLSVVDVEHASRPILLWRSLMQLAGGAGLAVVMLTAIAGPPGPGVPSAEGRADQLVPHVRSSARLVVAIYSGYAIFGILAYWTAGMGLFDAVNHAMAAVSTGGFSTKPDSIGHWNSPAIEAVTMVLVSFGNLNFLTAYVLLRGRFRTFVRDAEVQTFAVLTCVGTLALVLLLWRGVYASLTVSFRAAAFAAFSALSTTGFSTGPAFYTNWPPLAPLILTCLMLVGAGTCSTGGAIKQFRVYMLAQSLWREVRRSILPRSAVVETSIWQADRRAFVVDEDVRRVAAFVFLYLATWLVGSAVLAAHGYSVQDSLFEFASSLGTVGLSAGIATASSPPLVLWTETLGMFLGRMEFFVIFASLVKIARDLRAWPLR